MENILKKEFAERFGSHQLVYEDIQPNSDWTQDSKFHVLLIDLPGFKKEELKVDVDSCGKLAVSGEKKKNENKFQRFKQVFRVPDDSDLDKVTGRLDGGLLFIIIPKKINQTKEEEEHKKEEEKSNKQDDSSEKKEELVKGVLGKKECSRWSKFAEEKMAVDALMEKFNENKAVIITAVLAFSAGLYLCHKLRSTR